MNIESQEIVFMGERRPLTPDQAKIMGALFRRFALVCSQNHLADLVWGQTFDGPPDTFINCLRVHVSYLRRKMKGWPFVIVSDYEGGYSLCRAETEVTPHGRSRGIGRVSQDRYA